MLLTFQRYKNGVEVFTNDLFGTNPAVTSKAEFFHFIKFRFFLSNGIVDGLEPLGETDYIEVRNGNNETIFKLHPLFCEAPISGWTANDLYHWLLECSNTGVKITESWEY
jgi:hypothetical protein